MLFKTVLKGNKNKEILESVIGQLSDGMWENSPRMSRYWKSLDIITDDRGWLLIEFDPYIFGGKNNFLKWFANKIKQIIKEEDKWEKIGKFNFLNFNLTEYLSYKEEITVGDCYRVYNYLMNESKIY